MTKLARLTLAVSARGCDDKILDRMEDAISQFATHLWGIEQLEIVDTKDELTSRDVKKILDYIYWLESYVQSENYDISKKFLKVEASFKKLRLFK